MSDYTTVEEYDEWVKAKWPRLPWLVRALMWCVQFRIEQFENEVYGIPGQGAAVAEEEGNVEWGHVSVSEENRNLRGRNLRDEVTRLTTERDAARKHDPSPCCLERDDLRAQLAAVTAERDKFALTVCELQASIALATAGQRVAVKERDAARAMAREAIRTLRAIACRHQTWGCVIVDPTGKLHHPGCPVPRLLDRARRDGVEVPE